MGEVHASWIHMLSSRLSLPDFGYRNPQVVVVGGTAIVVVAGPVHERATETRHKNCGAQHCERWSSIQGLRRNTYWSGCLGWFISQ